MSDTTTPIPGEAVEAGARAAAIHDDYDGCFERVDEYEALLAEFPGEYESGDERPDSDYEDCEWWRVRARAALAAAVPVLLDTERERIAKAIEDFTITEAMRTGWDGTPGELGNWVNGIRHAANIARTSGATDE